MERTTGDLFAFLCYQWTTTFECVTVSYDYMSTLDMSQIYFLVVSVKLVGNFVEPFLPTTNCRGALIGCHLCISQTPRLSVQLSKFEQKITSSKHWSELRRSTLQLREIGVSIQEISKLMETKFKENSEFIY